MSVRAIGAKVVATKTDRVNEADPRVRRTRKLLQDAFVALLFEKGFPAISVQDVAERATVNRATFYAHFVDKYDLLDHVVGEWFRAALTTRVAPTAPFTPDNLRALIVTMLETLAQFHAHCHRGGRDLEPLVEAKAQEELRAFLLEWLRQSAPAEAGRRASPETVATVLSWAIFGAGIEWSRAAGDQPAVERAGEILTLLANGLPWPAAPTMDQHATSHR